MAKSMPQDFLFFVLYRGAISVADNGNWNGFFCGSDSNYAHFIETESRSKMCVFQIDIINEKTSTLTGYISVEDTASGTVKYLAV